MSDSSGRGGRAASAAAAADGGAARALFKAGMLDKREESGWVRKFCILDGARLRVVGKAAGAPVSQRCLTPHQRVLARTISTATLAIDEQTVVLAQVATLSVAVDKEGGRSYFLLCTHRGDAYCFSAPSVAELAPWVELLRTALDNVSTHKQQQQQHQHQHKQQPWPKFLFLPPFLYNGAFRSAPHGTHHNQAQQKREKLFRPAMQWAGGRRVPCADCRSSSWRHIF